MVYKYQKPLTEEEKAEQEDTTGLDPVLSGGGGELTSGGDGGSDSQGLDTKPVAGGGAQLGGATDIGAYLDVNKEKARQLASKVGGVITGDITKAHEGLASSQDQFVGAVDEATVNIDQDLFDTAQDRLTDPGATYGGYVTPNEVVPTPTPVDRNENAGPRTGGLAPVTNRVLNTASTDAPVVDPNAPAEPTLEEFLAENSEAFASQYGANYGGPQNILNEAYYQEALRDSANAERSASQIEDSVGRQELLARTLQPKSGRYSRGALALDQALLSKDSEAYATLAEAAAGSGDMQSRIEALQALTGERVQSAKDITGDTRQAYRDEFDLNREEGEIGQAYAEIKAQAEKIAKDKKDSLAGITENIDANAFFSDAKLAGLNKYNVASQDDLARLRALQDLTGIQSTYLPYEEQADSFQSYLDADTYFDEDRYNDVVATSKKNREAREAAMSKAEKEAADAEAEAKATQDAGMAGAATGAAIGSVVPVVGTAAGAVIGYVIGVSLCFDELTPILMKDKSMKFIKDIELGDETFLGGKVYSVSKHLRLGDLYAYDTGSQYIRVTGHHAVFEDGAWVRVKDSKNAVLLNEDQIDTNVVYSISNVRHRLMISNNLFADFDEVDNGHLYNDEQCLALLNKGDSYEEFSTEIL